MMSLIMKIFKKIQTCSLSVCVTYPQGTWVYGYLLSFGEYLIVKEPQQVQEVLKQQAKKILQNYQQDF